MRVDLSDILVAAAGAALIAAAATFFDNEAHANPPVTLVFVQKPADLTAAIKACTNTCDIRLVPGVYGDSGLVNLNLQPGKVQVDLTGSTFTNFLTRAVQNLTILGGTVEGGNQWGQCWSMDGDVGVIFLHVAAHRCGAAGFIITRSRDVMLLDWTTTDMLCDGVTVSGTDGFVVAGGHYSGYLPNPNSCHADGIQMWGMDGFPLTNGLVTNNDIYSTGVLLNDGKSYGIQGITAFGNNAPGGTAYPQSNITVTNNRMYLNGSWCVAIFNTTNVTAKDNRCVDEVPRAWNSNFGWNGSSGAIGPNYLNNVAQYYPPGREAAAKPPASKRTRRAKLKAAIVAAVLPPIFIAGASQREPTP